MNVYQPFEHTTCHLAAFRGLIAIFTQDYNGQSAKMTFGKASNEPYVLFR